MKLIPRMAIPMAAAMLIALPAAAPAQSFSPDQRHEIENVVKDYLMAHPQLLQDVINELDKQQKDAAADKARTNIKANNATLFNSTHQVVLGNPHGNVTMVEFFDYNCGYCKHALPDMMKLLQTDPNLKFVLKEFPVLGEGSVEAAHVAVAARMQDPTGAKYIEFHQKLLGGRGAADKMRALAVAKEVGFDMGRTHEGHGQRRGEKHDRGKSEACRHPRHRRHAELRRWERVGGWSRRIRRPGEKDRSFTEITALRSRLWCAATLLRRPEEGFPLRARCRGRLGAIEAGCGFPFTRAFPINGFGAAGVDPRQRH